jgi:very-short-patch-repair endonuclease
VTTRVLPESRQKARSLRKSLTKGEVLLWLELRTLKINGLHFRKQAPIGPYIVDFVCHSAKLVVEVDGDLHETEAGKRHDANRDAYLRSLGYEVVRFDSPDVLANPWHCAQEAKEKAARRLSDPTRPLRGHPPLKGEGSLRSDINAVEETR